MYLNVTFAFCFSGFAFCFSGFVLSSQSNADQTSKYNIIKLKHHKTSFLQKNEKYYYVERDEFGKKDFKIFRFRYSFQTDLVLN